MGQDTGQPQHWMTWLPEKKAEQKVRCMEKICQGIRKSKGFSHPVDLYLIFEKSSCKNQVQQTGFLSCKINFEIDFCRLHRQ